MKSSEFPNHADHSKLERIPSSMKKDSKHEPSSAKNDLAFPSSFINERSYSSSYRGDIHGIPTKNEFPTPPSSMNEHYMPTSGFSEFTPRSEPAGSRSERSNAIPMPIPRTDYYSAASGVHDRSFTAGSPLRNNFPSPSSNSYQSGILRDDDASVAASGFGDGEEDKASELEGAAPMTYARKRKHWRTLSKSSVNRLASYHIKETWTQKIQDYRDYEVAILKSLLPLKAAVAATLASIIAFAPFLPTMLTYYGTTAVVGVGMTLEPNVGQTLQKGYNLALGSALAGVCSFLVSQVEVYTGSFRICFLIMCTFLGGCVPRMISLPSVIKSRWGQVVSYYIAVFHGLILWNPLLKKVTSQFLYNCMCYSIGFLLAFTMGLCIKPEFAGDSLLKLLVSDFHTAGVVLERIVEDYRSGMVLTKVEDLFRGVVSEDLIHQDLQFIMKSTEEVDKLMTAVQWEPPHGKFFRGYPWWIYPKLLALLCHVMYDLIALDSSLRAEIQAPPRVRKEFAEHMEAVAKTCSMLLHSIGDGLLEHKMIDHQRNVQHAKKATDKLKVKLSMYSAYVIAQDYAPEFSRNLTRTSSISSAKEDQDLRSVTENYFSELVANMAEYPPDPPSSPQQVERVLESEPESVPQSNANDLRTDEVNWRERLLLRQQSVVIHMEETREQFSSLSFLKFASILIELMAKVKIVVTMVDKLAVEAKFSPE